MPPKESPAAGAGRGKKRTATQANLGPSPSPSAGSASNPINLSPVPMATLPPGSVPGSLNPSSMVSNGNPPGPSLGNNANPAFANPVGSPGLSPVVSMAPANQRLNTNPQGTPHATLSPAQAQAQAQAQRLPPKVPVQSPQGFQGNVASPVRPAGQPVSTPTQHVGPGIPIQSPGGGPGQVAMVKQQPMTPQTPQTPMTYPPQQQVAEQQQQGNAISYDNLDAPGAPEMEARFHQLVTQLFLAESNQSMASFERNLLLNPFAKDSESVEEIVAEYRAKSQQNEQQGARFLRYVLVFVTERPKRPPKATRLAFKVLTALIPHTATHLRYVMTSLVTHLTVDSELQWNLTCEFLLASIERVPKDVQREMFGRLIAASKALPANLSWKQLKCVDSMKAVTNKIVADLLPLYAIMHVLPTKNPGDPPVCHFSYEKSIDAILLRRRSLQYFFTPSGAEKRTLVINSHRPHELSTTLLKVNRLDLGEQELSGGIPAKESLFRDLLTQQSFVDFFRNVPHIASKGQLLRAIIWMIEECLKATHQQLALAGTSHQVELIIWTIWGRLGDVVYSLLLIKFFEYPDLVEKLCKLVHPGKVGVPPDNFLGWLLVQLVFIDHTFALYNNMADDEEKMNQLFSLYTAVENPPFPFLLIRDLAFHCLNALKVASGDKSLLSKKFLYPKLWGSQGQFEEIRERFDSFKSEPRDLRTLSTSDLTMLGVMSQVKPPSVATYILNCLIKVVDNEALQSLPNNSGLYAQFSTLSTDFVEILSVACKQHLAGFIQEKLFVNPAAGSQALPYVQPPALLEGIAKLYHSSRISTEQFPIRQFLKKLKGILVLLATSQTEAFNRICHTVLEFSNFRLIRLLKYSIIFNQLFLIVSDPIVTNRRWQLYESMEIFVMNIASNLTDWNFPKFLRQTQMQDEILSFGNSELLKRATVQAMARVIRTKGSHDVSPDILNQILQKFYDKKPHYFSPKTLKFFPPGIENFYKTKIPPKRIGKEEMNKILQTPIHNCIWNTSSPESLLNFYSTPANQPSFLCVLWSSSLRQNRFTGNHAHIRRVFLQFTDEAKSLATWTFVDFVVDGGHDQLTKNILSEYIWKFHFVPFEHVLLGLVRGNRDDDNEGGFVLFDHLLDEKSEFHTRYEYWIGPAVNVNPKFWLDDDSTSKLETYYKKFPEYFDYEVALKADSQNCDPPLQPPLPIYYTSVILRTIPFLDLAIGKLIEFEKTEILLKVLTRYQRLYQYHGNPLSFVHDTFLYYYESPLMRDPNVVRAFLLLLEPSTPAQYPFSPELLQNLHPQKGSHDGYLSAGYFTRLVKRFAEALDRDKFFVEPLNTLPHSNYREVVNPILQLVLVLTTELMAAPKSAIASAEENPLIAAVLRAPEPITQNTIVALGMLVANLPEGLKTHWFGQMLLTLKTHPLCQQGSAPGPSPLAELFTARETGATGVDAFSSSEPNPFSSLIFNNLEVAELTFCASYPSRMLALFQAILHFSSVDTLIQFRELLENIRREDREKGEPFIKSDTQLLFLCRVLGNSFVRLQRHVPKVLVEYVIDIFSMMAELEKVQEDTATFGIDTVIDFLYSLKTEMQFDNALRQHKPTVEYIKSKPKLRFFLDP